MTPKDTAEQLVKKHLTAIAEESMDSDGIMFYAAKQCALVTVDMILDNNPGSPKLFDAYFPIPGIVSVMTTPQEYWLEVKSEIQNCEYRGI